VADVKEPEEERSCFAKHEEDVEVVLTENIHQVKNVTSNALTRMICSIFVFAKYAVRLKMAVVN
jgi:hypothetical protein